MKVLYDLQIRKIFRMVVSLLILRKVIFLERIFTEFGTMFAIWRLHIEIIQYNYSLKLAIY